MRSTGSPRSAISLSFSSVSRASASLDGKNLQLAFVDLNSALEAHLVLADGSLQAEKTGGELLSQAAEEIGRPVLAAINAARAAGVDTFVPKPLFAGSVMDEFREAFKRKNRDLIQERADLKGRRVLLAEDVAVNAEIMIMVLSMREIEADLAENGRIAVDKYESHEAGYYDAILMDMHMPEMDGLTATKAIRDSGREDAMKIPIIALTANAFDEDVQRSLQAGLNAHLSKPVDPDALFDTLETLIRP